MSSFIILIYKYHYFNNCVIFFSLSQLLQLFNNQNLFLYLQTLYFILVYNVMCTNVTMSICYPGSFILYIYGI